MKGQAKRLKGDKPAWPHHAIKYDEIAVAGVAPRDIGSDLHDHTILLISFRKRAAEAETVFRFCAK